MQGVSGNFRPSFVENGGCWPAKPALMGKKQHPNDLKCLFWRNVWQKNALTWQQLTTAFLREVGLWRRTAKNRRDFGRPIFHPFFRHSSDIFQPISPYIPQTMLSMIFKALQIAKASLGFCSLSLVSFVEWVSWDLCFAFCTLSLCSNTQFRGTKWKKMRFPTKFARSTSSNCHGMSRDKPALGKRWGSAGRVGKRCGSAGGVGKRWGSAGGGGADRRKYTGWFLGCAEGALCDFHDVNCPLGSSNDSFAFSCGTPKSAARKCRQCQFSPQVAAKRGGMGNPVKIWHRQRALSSFSVEVLKKCALCFLDTQKNHTWKR